MPAPIKMIVHPEFITDAVARYLFIARNTNQYKEIQLLTCQFYENNFLPELDALGLIQETQK